MIHDVGTGFYQTVYNYSDCVEHTYVCNDETVGVNIIIDPLLLGRIIQRS